MRYNLFPIFDQFVPTTDLNGEVPKFLPLSLTKYRCIDIVRLGFFITLCFVSVTPSAKQCHFFIT